MTVGDVALLLLAVTLAGVGAAWLAAGAWVGGALALAGAVTAILALAYRHGD